MKGKIGIVVGLGVGYVLGTRAGRERYEQIKTQWLKVWHLDPVQAQVEKVKGFAKEQAAAVPTALWNGAVKVVKAATSEGTPGQKLDSTIDAGKQAADEVKDVVEDVVEDAAEAVEQRLKAAKKTTSSAKSAPAKSASAKKTPRSGA